ncbi:hypothetical protein BCV71DRAFT_11366 [Rhizopus microsporus]|uniref:Uncharacterized protein n=1 Tax=Rhizopus microsporus TaxID=58291 RepID=A0A1X0RXU7_RHIZD|nr:hypothetical protein BCV71DRAFT_11366 [Rhizopus microsporus]
MSKQSSDNDPSSGIIRRKRGRPKKQQSIQASTASVGKKRGRPPKALVEKRERPLKALVEEKEQVNESAPPRKRGRPRKHAPKEIIAPVIRVTTRDKKKQKATVDSGESYPKAGSKRGRPRKTPKKETKEETKEPISIRSKREHPSQVPNIKKNTQIDSKKRGRPRKTPLENDKVQAKKKGRPPKALVSEESQTVSRKRGRPRKDAAKPNKSPKSTKSEEDDDSSSIADFSELLSDEDDEEEEFEPNEDYHFSHSPGKTHHKRIKLFKKYREQSDIDYDIKAKKGKRM